MLSFMETNNTIETPRLVLRPFKESDWEEVHVYGSDPKVCEFMEWGPNTLGDTRDFVHRSMRLARQHPRVGYEFAIEEKSDARLIGSIGLYLHEPKRQQALMGYTFASRCWGRGFGTEAACAMIEFGFGKLKLHRISATCDVRNIASYRVMEKCGMRREGLFLQEKYVKGQWRDTLLYSILAFEWNGSAIRSESSTKIDI
jgi:[ribosomal protein S5]-alanine N-acetyltransferase